MYLFLNSLFFQELDSGGSGRRFESSHPDQLNQKLKLSFRVRVIRQCDRIVTDFQSLYSGSHIIRRQMSISHGNPYV